MRRGVECRFDPLDAFAVDLVRMVVPQPTEDGGRAGDLRAHDLARDAEPEALVLRRFVLPHPDRQVLRSRRRQLAAQLPGAGEVRQLDAMVEQLEERLGGDLDVAEDQDRVDFRARHFEQQLAVFFEPEAVAGLPEDRLLFGQIENRHPVPSARSAR